MQFIQLTDESGREVWVNLDLVSKVVPEMWRTNGEPTVLEISFDGGLPGITLKDPAEIERLRGILSVLASRMGETNARAEKGEVGEISNVVLIAAVEETGTCPDGDVLAGEDFSEITRVHDWRNHIPIRMREGWHLLSPETQITAFLFAQRQAQDEEWE